MGGGVVDIQIPLILLRILIQHFHSQLFVRITLGDFQDGIPPQDEVGRGIIDASMLGGEGVTHITLAQKWWGLVLMPHTSGVDATNYAITCVILGDLTATDIGRILCEEEGGVGWMVVDGFLMFFPQTHLSRTNQTTWTGALHKSRFILTNGTRIQSTVPRALLSRTFEEFLTGELLLFVVLLIIAAGGGRRCSRAGGRGERNKMRGACAII